MIIFYLCEGRTALAPETMTSIDKKIKKEGYTLRTSKQVRTRLDNILVDDITPHIRLKRPKVCKKLKGEHNFVLVASSAFTFWRPHKILENYECSACGKLKTKIA